MVSIWNRGFRNSNLERVVEVPNDRRVADVFFMSLHLQNSTEELADYLESVHPYFDWIETEYINGQKRIPIFRPSFVSDPIGIGTASDNISQLGLSWKRVAAFRLTKENVYDIYLSGAGVEPCCSVPIATRLMTAAAKASAEQTAPVSAIQVSAYVP